MEKEDLTIAIMRIRADYESALRDVANQAKWMRSELDDVDRHPAEAFTPGNLSSMCGKLEAARWKAYALRESLAALGVKV